MYLHQLRIHPNAQLMKRARKEIDWERGLRYPPGSELLSDSGEDTVRLNVPTDSVGYDIYAPEKGFLDPLSRKLIPLGFAASFTPGYICKYFDRSGMGNKGIHHFAGVIDPDYRDEWKVILWNSTHQAFHWEAGDRLIQAVFWQVEVVAESQWVTELEKTFRNKGGLGSTGR